MRKLIFLAVIAVSSLAFAKEPDNCRPARVGHVTIRIERMGWELKGGEYQIVSHLICHSTAELPVLAGRAAGCTYPVLATCRTLLDGEKHEIIVSGLAYHANDEAGQARKYFSAGFHVDRNSTEVKTGEASGAQISSKDLGLKEISLSLDSKIDGPGGSSREAVSVEMDFEDSHAR